MCYLAMEFFVYLMRLIISEQIVWDSSAESFTEVPENIVYLEVEASKNLHEFLPAIRRLIGLSPSVCVGLYLRREGEKVPANGCAFYGPLKLILLTGGRRN